MRGPLGFYVELVDGAAFDKAESGETIGQFGAPILPLLFPWVLGGPALAFLRLSKNWSDVVFGATIAASIVCWCGFAFFYYRQVQRYRKQLGTDRNNS